jgi:hypothetical protein
MPTGRARFGLATARNGRLYAIGGATNILGAVATVEEYTP